MRVPLQQRRETLEEARARIADPVPPAAATVTALQRTAGNQAVTRMLAPQRRKLARLQSAAAFHTAASGGGAFDVTLANVETQLDMCHLNAAGLTHLRYSANQAEQQTYADRRMGDLDALEKLIYAWLAPRNGQPPRQGAALAAANALLDDVQTTHRQFVNGYVHANNLDLWAADAPTGPARAALNADWNALRNGGGRLQVTQQARAGAGAGPQNMPGFADEMRAMHARLLSRPGGRQLLHDLVNGPHNPEVSVEPYNPAVVALFGGMAGAEAAADNRPHALAGPGSTMAAPVGNLGSASTMAVQSGLRDSQEHNIDAQNRPIASPAFMLYAHELVHAHHNMRGRNRASLPQSARYQAGGDLYEWENTEEHATIEAGHEPISENSIRAEHQLPARYGHRH